ncbi:Reticulocyte-binding protein 2 like a [Dissostichus eleginoides]|uniref:Reticulocyte-binding protein 2 like a n=1 Tax=Dissostichus eleginoides TaxID=100907 RepID=A0AAD9BQ58_DISEL|nr:Reticulocyte-binding protein 2 like a [Dissostichus eleginoides]
MSLRAKSHTDLQTAGRSSLDDRLSFSMSSSNFNRGSRFGNGTGEEVKGHSRSIRRPECEDLRKENKFLSNEIHMERIMMRTESELTMRNLRNLNQELQAQLKQKLYLSQQRVALCSRAADEAEGSRCEAEKMRNLAELLRKEHTGLQLSAALTEKSYFESQLKLDRVSGEKQVLLQENRSTQGERDELRHKLRNVTEENVQIKQREMDSRRRAVASEEEGKKANQAQREAEAERRLAEKERQERASECLRWREKHQEINERFRAEENLKALRQNKSCQANIKSYFLCMTESNQRVKILRNQDGAPRNFTEGDPVFIPTPECSPEEPERSSSRTLLRVSAPLTGRDHGPGHFDELPAFGGAERPDSAPHPRRSRKVVDYFWIPTDQE